MCSDRTCELNTLVLCLDHLWVWMMHWYDIYSTLFSLNMQLQVDTQLKQLDDDVSNICDQVGPLLQNLTNLCLISYWSISA